MVRPTRLALVLPLALATGCQCGVDNNFAPIDDVDITDDYGKWLSMGVGPDGSPVIAYYDVTLGGLGFAIGSVKTDGTVSWRHERVDGFPDSTGMDTGDVGQFTSLQVARDGTIWVSYYGGNALRVAHRVNGEWTWEVADSGTGMAPNTGQWTSLALDGNDSPVVAEYDVFNRALRVARQNDGVWTAETVATGVDWVGTDPDGNAITRPADVGQFARLAIVGDTEYIAYWDGAAQDLRLAEGFPGAYADSVVYDVPGGNVGEWPSMHFDGDVLSIAFEDRANGDLMLGTREGTAAFRFETIDADDYVGSDTELFVKDGDLAVLYFDGRYNDMKLATHDENGWATQKVGGDDGAVGFFNEVATTRGRTFAASYDYTHKHLFWQPL
jgi:hypothetical protein